MRFFLISLLLINSFKLAALHYNKHVTADQQLVHVIELNPKQYRLKAVKANNILAKAAKEGHAIAGINGGFFHADGSAAGILKIEDWYSIAYSPRAAIGWKDNNVDFDIVQTKSYLNINNKQYKINSFNQPGTTPNKALVNEKFGSHTISAPGLYDIVIDSENKVIAINNVGNTPIPSQGLVFTLNASTFKNNPIAIGSTAELVIEVLPELNPTQQEFWQHNDFIIGGTPLLLKDGKMLNNYREHKFSTRPFITNRYARSAIGKLNNGNIVLVVAEKSKFSASPGMSIAELIDFLISIGCKDALNLDGGGSSALFFQEKIVNYPDYEDKKHEFSLPLHRPVSDVILVLPK